MRNRKRALLILTGLWILLYSILACAATEDGKKRIEYRPDLLQALPRNQKFVLKWQQSEWDGKLEVVQGTYGGKSRILVQIGESRFAMRVDAGLRGVYAVLYEGAPFLLMEFSPVKGNGIIFAYSLAEKVSVGNVELEEEDLRRGQIETDFGHCFTANLWTDGRSYTFFVQRKGGIRQTVDPAALLGEYRIAQEDTAETQRTRYLDRPLVLADRAELTEDTVFSTAAAGGRVVFMRYQTDGRYDWYFVQCGKKEGWFALDGDGERLLFQNAGYGEVFSNCSATAGYVSPDTGYTSKGSGVIRTGSTGFMQDQLANELADRARAIPGTDPEKIVVGRLNFAGANPFEIYVLQYKTDRTYCRLYMNIEKQLFPIRLAGQMGTALRTAVFDENGLHEVKKEYRLNGSPVFPLEGDRYYLANFNELVKVTENE